MKKERQGETGRQKVRQAVIPRTILLKLNLTSRARREQRNRTAPAGNQTINMIIFLPNSPFLKRH